MNTMRWIAIGVIALAAAATVFFLPKREAVVTTVQGKRTVDDRLAEFTTARQRVREQFAAAGVAYPPRRVVLLGLKDEKRLEVYAGDTSLKRVASYPILAASGVAGPKLREGDLQVPEGVYPVESLNPNSRYHVALRVGYPSAFDRANAKAEGRTNLGGDIMIHGKAASVGCLAMGDPAAEDLFVVAAESGIGNVKIVLAPWDLRTRPAPEADGWRRGMYDEITRELEKLPQ
jgi:murein L,D-transpeptidase YafK